MNNKIIEIVEKNGKVFLRTAWGSCFNIEYDQLSEVIEKLQEMKKQKDFDSMMHE
jgi:uncharacterized protein YlzI (FlbEa/FlbD family)